MKKYFIAISFYFIAANAYANSFYEQVKVKGFVCENNRISISLRSLEKDYLMSLAENASGKPIALSISIQQCQALTKNLSRGFIGKVFLAEFLSTEFIAKKTVYQGGSNSSCRTKCSDPHEVEVDTLYRRTETILEEYRFFDVVELDPVH